MKKIGLLGGVSWVSTLDYYRYINEGINERLGGLNYAECIIYSLNFNDIQRHGWDDWGETFRLVSDACRHLKAAGAEALVLCANTAHAIAERVEADVQLPLIHIATATADAVSRRGLKRVGLLGTKFTMELPFYKDKLRVQGIESLVPQEQAVRDFIQQTVKEELGRGIVRRETKAAYIEIANQLIASGAEGIVLGCTEIPLLLSQQDVAVPVFDTARIHAQAAVDFALSGYHATQ
jgi:aspartate racemase